MDALSRGTGFDVLLTANGFDHALLGEPGEHGQRFCPALTSSATPHRLGRFGPLDPFPIGAQSLQGLLAEWLLGDNHHHAVGLAA